MRTSEVPFNAKRAPRSRTSVEAPRSRPCNRCRSRCSCARQKPRSTQSAHLAFAHLDRDTAIKNLQLIQKEMLRLLRTSKATINANRTPAFRAPRLRHRDQESTTDSEGDASVAAHLKSHNQRKSYTSLARTSFVTNLLQLIARARLEETRAKLRQLHSAYTIQTCSPIFHCKEENLESLLPVALT